MLRALHVPFSRFLRLLHIALRDGLDKMPVFFQRLFQPPRMPHRNRAKARELVTQIEKDADEARIAARLIQKLSLIHIYFGRLEYGCAENERFADQR